MHEDCFSVSLSLGVVFCGFREHRRRDQTRMAGCWRGPATWDREGNSATKRQTCHLHAMCLHAHVDLNPNMPQTEVSLFLLGPVPSMEALLSVCGPVTYLSQLHLRNAGQPSCFSSLSPHSIAKSHRFLSVRLQDYNVSGSPTPPTPLFHHSFP